MSPIHLLQELYGDDPRGLFSSIDLSAATDRLPISLQVSVLKVLLEDLVPDSQLFAEAWRDLLIKRQYSTGLGHTKPTFDSPVIKGKIRPSFLMKRKDFTVSAETPSHVMYSVGQPMGALSS
jgi:hypothetical protein